MGARIMRCSLAISFVAVTALHAGSYSFDFLDIGVGTRARALGGSFVSVADDGSAMLWNPAGSSNAASSRFYFSHNSNFSGMATMDYISFVKPIVGHSSFSLAVIRHKVDDIPIFPELEGTPEERDTTPELQGDGNPLGYFGETASIYFINVAKKFRIKGSLISLGGNFKYFDESIYNTNATGIGVDLGTILSFNAKIPGTFGVGISMQDIAGTQIVWNTRSQAKDEIPMNWRLGVHYLVPIARFSTTLRFSYDRTTRYEGTNHAGIEYSFKENFVADLGWNQSKWCFGTGVKFWKICIQYGFITHSLGSSQAVSMEFIL